MIFGLFKTMYFFILHFEVRNLGYKQHRLSRSQSQFETEVKANFVSKSVKVIYIPFNVSPLVYKIKLSKIVGSKTPPFKAHSF